MADDLATLLEREIRMVESSYTRSVDLKAYDIEAALAGPADDRLKAIAGLFLVPGVRVPPTG